MEQLAERTRSSFTDSIFNPESGGESSRLSRLLEENAEIARRKNEFRCERHETEAAMMRSPVTIAEAYGYFGLLLGMLPPAAIFGRFFQYGLAENAHFFFVFCLLMNLVCAVVGKYVAASFALYFDRAERKSWSKMIFQTAWLGFCWAVITGAAGGLISFGFGAIFGALCAVPVGVAAFPIFASMHRTLERGNEMELKHFLPFAFGISTAISAFILGL